MLKRLNKMDVESSDGFKLIRRHRFYYHYVEGDRILQFYVEPSRELSGSYFEQCDENSLKKWLPPHEGEPITEQSVRRIKKNVSDALAFMDIPHRWK
jgi:hypothetical protein